MNVLVVGAGFAGATVARELAEAGHQVLVIDKRDHIGGNAYDYMNELGIRVHKYGPHLWHTSNDEVHAWASRFTEWVPYRHYVTAQLANGVYTPLPINHKTIEDVFGFRFTDWASTNGWSYYDHEQNWLCRPGAQAAFLETVIEHHPEVTNSRQHVENSVGKELCDLFFEPYTKKMWGLSLSELPASVAARIPTNVESRSFEYFPKDKHQFLPSNGYAAMFERIFDHENIQVQLDSVFEFGAVWKNGIALDKTFDHVFTAQPIDTYFGCQLGELPWRSIKMHVQNVALGAVALPASAVVNFTHDGPYTRVTEWKRLPAHGDNPYATTLTFEEPCDYRDNSMERYYPVKTSLEVCPNRELYKKYRDMADALPNVTFIGRCGMYAYQDMHAVISTSMAIVRKFLQENINAEV
jgi:UDP-galactopyranose mutase